MRRLLHLVGFAAALAIIAGLALLGSSNLSLTALTLIVGSAGVAAFQSTLASLIAGVRVRLAPRCAPGSHVLMSSGKAGILQPPGAFDVELVDGDTRHVIPITIFLSDSLTISPIPSKEETQ